MMNKKKELALFAGLVICSAIVVITEGVKPNLFTVWNLLPVIYCYLLFRKAISNSSITMIGGSVGFALTGIPLLLFVHAAWFFDWEGTKTGSSTGGLIFVFIPIYSIIVGGIGYLVGWLIAKARN